jgi:hypothetical protein
MSDATVKLGWDNSAARAGAAEAVSIAQQVGVKSEKALSKMGVALGGLGQAVAGLAVGAQIKSTLDQFGRIGDLANRFDTSREGLQRLNQVAVMSGTDLETAARALTLLNKALDDPANKKAAEAFGRLGVNIAELKQADSFEQIQMLSAAFQKAQATGTGFADIMQLLGKSGVELIPLLRTSADEMARFASTSVVSDEQVKQLELLGDKLDEVNLKVSAGMGSILATGVGIWENIVKGASESVIYADEVAAALERGATFAEAVREAGAFMQKMNVAEAEEKESVRPGEKTDASNEGALAGRNVTDQGPANKDIDEARRQFAEAEFAALQKRVGLEQQVGNLKKLQADRTAEMRAEMDKGPVSEKRMLDYALANLKIKEEIRDLDRQIVAQKKADSDLAADAARSAAEAGRAQSMARADAERELEILRLKASGQEAAATAAEEELKIKRDAESISEALNISYKAALEMAREKAGLEKKVNDEGDGAKEGRIQGFSAEKMGGRDEARNRAAQRAALSEAKRGAAYERGFGGLDDFYADQRDPNFARAKTPLLDAAFGKRQPMISTEKVSRTEGRSQGSESVVGVLADSKSVQERIAAAVELLSVA